MPPPRAEARLRVQSWDPVCPSCGSDLGIIPTDETAVNPHNQYAVSKYTQELVALNLGGRYELPTACMRYSIVQGPWQSFHNAYSGVCRIFTTRVLHGRRPVAFEDGGQMRDYVWVGDVARANLLALESDRAAGQVYNVGGATSCSVMDYGRSVAQQLGKPELTPEIPGLYRYGDTRHVISDTQKLRELGWAPTLGVPEIVGRYAEWASAQPDLVDNLDQSLRRMLELGTVRRAPGAAEEA